MRVDTTSRSRIALASAPIAVADGDYFECQVWQNASGSLDVEADPKTWFAIVAIEFAAFRGVLVRLTADEPVANSTDAAIPWDATIYDTNAYWSAGSPTRLTVPAGVSKVRLKGNLDRTFGGTGYRHLWMHQNGGPGERRGRCRRAEHRQRRGPGHARRLFRAPRPPDLRRHQERRRRRAHLVRHRGRGVTARRVPTSAAATSTSALFGIYRWGWGFSTSQDFNGDIALIACFASSWTPAMVRRWHADPFGFLPMERGPCAHGQRATLDAPLDRHGRGHLPDGVASNGL